MKRFFCVSIFFHAGLFFLFSSWEIPRADRLLAWSKIEVALVEEVKEKKDLPAPLPGRKEKQRPAKKAKESPPPAVRTEEKEKKEEVKPSQEIAEKAAPAPLPPNPHTVTTSKAEVSPQSPREEIHTTSGNEPRVPRSGAFLALPSAARMEKGDRKSVV
jgi:outer membrane biosynthesis protein TonB